MSLKVNKTDNECAFASMSPQPASHWKVHKYSAGCDYTNCGVEIWENWHYYDASEPVLEVTCFDCSNDARAKALYKMKLAEKEYDIAKLEYRATFDCV